MAQGVSVDFQMELGRAVTNVVELTRKVRDAKGELKDLANQAGTGVKGLENLFDKGGKAAGGMTGEIAKLTGRLLAIVGPAAAVTAAIAGVNRVLEDQSERTRQAVDGLRNYVESDAFKQLLAAAGGTGGKKLQIERVAADLSSKAGLPNAAAVSIASKAALEGQTPADALAAAQLAKTSPGVRAEDVIDVASKYGVGGQRFADLLKGVEAQSGGTTPAETLQRMDRLAPAAKEAGIGVEELTRALAVARDKGDVRGSTAAIQMVLEAVGGQVAAGRQPGGLPLTTAIAEYATTAPDDFAKLLQNPAFRRGLDYAAESQRLAPTPTGLVERDAALRAMSPEGAIDRQVAAEAARERATRRRGAAGADYNTLRTTMDAALESSPLYQSLLSHALFTLEKTLGPTIGGELLQNRGLLGEAPSERVQNPGPLLDDATYGRLRQQARREVLRGPGQTSLADITPDFMVPTKTMAEIEKRLAELIELQLEANRQRDEQTAAIRNGAAGPRSLRDHRADDFEGRSAARVGVLVAGLMRGI